ncbi:MAG: transglycosylase SLT domain-containing protein [Thermodesulfobacteriota bacterium]
MKLYSGFSIVFAILIISAFTSDICSAEVYYHKKKQGVNYYTNVKPATGKGYKKLYSYWGSKSKQKAKSLKSFQYTDQYDHLILHAAEKYNLDPNLIKAMIKVESDFYSDAVSPKGAMGLMQLMPQTASRMGVINPYNTRDNILGGTKYFRFLLDLFSENKTLALAGYNAGENAVIKYGYSIPPYRETEDYVDKVFNHYNHLKKNDSKLLVKRSNGGRISIENTMIVDKNKKPSISYRETLDSVEITPVKKSKVIVQSVEYHDSVKVKNKKGNIKYRDTIDSIGIAKEIGEYTVQIASFSDLDSAKEMEESLKSKTYPVYIMTATVPNKGTWYRVRIGEFNSKYEAINYAENLKREQPYINSPIVTSLN